MTTETDSKVFSSSVSSGTYGYAIDDDDDCMSEKVKQCNDDDDEGASSEKKVKVASEVVPVIPEEDKKFHSDNSSSSSSSSSSNSSSSRSRRRSTSGQMEYIVKLRGLPWSCTKDDIIDFLGSECKIYHDSDGIHMISTSDGKASGEALVELASEDDQMFALKKDKRNMGHRYIEVFKITKSEMDWVLKRNRPIVFSNGSFNSSRSSPSGSSNTYVRLRGLPYDCTKEDIYHFFNGLEIVSNGIQLMVDGIGRSIGEAYVQFASKDQAHKAQGKDRELIKHRYVEIFTVSPAELRNLHSMVTRRSSSFNNRSTPYDRAGRRDSRYGSGGARQSSSRSFRGRGGYDSDSWNNYDTWGNGGGRSGMNPPPLMPGLRRGSRGDEGNTKHCVLMRGLPYRAEESHIRKFFAPLCPTAVHIIYESPGGRPSGTAKVNFASNDDVTRAMAKHKDRMEHRYIELFVHRN